MTETFKYQNSCIYRIYCKDTNITDCYIGSTVYLKNRKQSHKSSCNNPNTRKYNLKVYKIIRENKGIDNWNFEILETIPCNKYNELIKYEKLYYEKYNSTLNTTYPGRSDKQYRNDNKEVTSQKKKEYYKKNKEVTLQKQKEYYKKNKEVTLQRCKEYREKNKEKILQKKKEWCDNNKEVISHKKKEYYKKNKVKINCIFCNKLITKYNMKRHQKTKRCMKIQEIIKK